MQVSQKDSKGCKRVGVEEHLIKFRPSPNFKNMKKFMKSKMDHLQITNRASPNAAPDPTPPPNIGRSERVTPVVQPPLPLDPPPPDSPIYLNMIVKQEVEDTDYQSACGNSPEIANQESQGNGESQNVTPEKPTEKTKMPICRDYIRGTCKRQGTCKFAHKYDVSQLEGVYTFCHKYQNSVCTFANCKYVHADVFEERQFYRTGILPPHALAHHKKVLQPPPPPPPPEEPQPDLPPITFTNPPPPLHTEIDKSILSVIPSSSLESRGFTDLLPPTRYTSPLKREWSNIEPFGSTPCDLDTNEHLTKKCKHCDIMEFRLQYNKDKVQKMRQTKEELNKKMAILDKKSEKLYTIIMALLKPQMSSKSQSHTNGLTLLNGDNKDKSLLEQLNAIMNVTSRLSTLGEDK
ncbi:uncharacterized protein LOC125076186 isoform X1 [Vanessa atalanta]|uniref:uncharacterized protein LOC125076186 isoform X1 n=1 Tax=Vanessa atalanta TaxID=42275 RepID=UPI001FCD6B3F|nr:uncharacterized protein LOC125076186 isoform X1 [Vanessa atalanta]XP_047544154.1 uncharacterized protein LOC125076186 isoform X1 [Vanessa atalanta]